MQEQRRPSEAERLQANARTCRDLAAAAEQHPRAAGLVAGAGYTIAAALYELAAAHARPVHA